VFKKGIFLDIQNDHRISCQVFTAVFLQIMVLFRGFYTVYVVEVRSDVSEECASSVFRMTETSSGGC
jgi:hypothetical protein